MGDRVRGHVLEGESGGTGYVHLRKEAEKDDLSAYKYLGARGGRNRGREGIVIRVGKSQEWWWG